MFGVRSKNVREADALLGVLPSASATGLCTQRLNLRSHSQGRGRAEERQLRHAVVPHLWRHRVRCICPLCRVGETETAHSYGRIRIGLLFRSVDVQLPRSLLAYDVGSVAPICR